MKIIYHCYGGTHSSVTAASIHMGLLPEDKLPTENELNNVSIFDSPKKIIKGRMHYFGDDSLGNQIYSCGMKNSANIVKIAIKDVLTMYGYKPNSELKFVDTLPCVNLYMRVGGYTSQRLNLKLIGRPLVLKGTQKAYFDIAKLVRETKSKLSNSSLLLSNNLKKR